jgi:hypothetical protein
VRDETPRFYDLGISGRSCVLLHAVADFVAGADIVWPTATQIGVFE